MKLLDIFAILITLYLAETAFRLVKPLISQFILKRMVKVFIFLKFLRNQPSFLWNLFLESDEYQRYKNAFKKLL